MDDDAFRFGTRRADSRRSADSHVRAVFPQKPATYADEAARAPFTLFLIPRQTVGGLVPARPVLLQAFHHDPVQVAPDKADQLFDRAVVAARQRPPSSSPESATF